MLIVLPWPPSILSPNARSHWAARAKYAKAYRRACWALTLEAKLPPTPAGRVRIAIEFVPPDRRCRDLDNMLAATKPGLDGLADALGVNDRRFDIGQLRVADAVGGFVRVEL
jgi:crossover junction endodeoxyribonuclease RusA